MEDEPKYFYNTGYINEMTVQFKGEKFKGSPISDTEVSLNGSFLCCITWQDKEAFLKEIKQVINKYQI